MSSNTQNKDIRTKAFVLRRTNYGEADRILNLITPSGKVSAMAKGVRKEKSKLAGNVEMFCLLDLDIHQGKNEFGIVTSAKMQKYYKNLIIDLERMELASLILRKVNTAAEHTNSPDLFDIVYQTLESLDKKANQEIVETWFWFNFAKAIGEQVNLYRDNNGKKLEQDKTYVWDNADSVLKEQLGGNIAADEIKIMRLMLTSKLELIQNIKGIEHKIPSILYIAKSINKI